MKTRNSTKASRNGDVPAMVCVPQWKPHLNSYHDKQLLRFSDKHALHAALEVLWTEPFRTLPHCTPDGRSIVVPAEAVEHLARAGLNFTATKLKGIRDLTSEQIKKLRH